MTRKTFGNTTRADLVATAARASGLSESVSRIALEAMLSVLRDNLEEAKRGDQVTIEIRGFGTFKTRYKRARPARNPRTGALVPLSARRVVTWRPAFRITFPEKGPLA